MLEEKGPGKISDQRHTELQKSSSFSSLLSLLQVDLHNLFLKTSEPLRECVSGAVNNTSPLKLKVHVTWLSAKNEVDPELSALTIVQLLSRCQAISPPSKFSRQLMH